MNNDLKASLKRLVSKAQKAGQVLERTKMSDVALGSSTPSIDKRLKERFEELCAKLNEAEKALRDEELQVQLQIDVLLRGNLQAGLNAAKEYAWVQEKEGDAGNPLIDWSEATTLVQSLQADV